MNVAQNTGRSFFELTYADFLSWMRSNNLNPSAADQLFKDLYRHGLETPRWHKISAITRQKVEHTFSFQLPSPVQIHESDDGTVKFLFSLFDGNNVESVLIPFQQKYTLCLSSQVGCAMGCSFCHTGTQGFERHLHAGEMVGQYMRTRQWLKKHRPNDARILNVVFMGQGEPLHNFDAVRLACHIFLMPRGPGLAAYKITVSTCGYMPGLSRWTAEMPNVNIALSLHAPDNDRRAQLIPMSKVYPLEMVLRQLDAIPLGRKRYLTFEYLLIKDFNDSADDAAVVGKILQQRKAILNIIPFNPYPGARYQRPTDAATQRFATHVSSFGIPVMIRATKGTDILAACGQLKSHSL